MTPKEKAKELIDKMLIGFIDWTYHVPTELNDNHNILSEAKQRALIAVDEMLKEHFGDISDYGTRRYYFLKEVKQEIEKL